MASVRMCKDLAEGSPAPRWPHGVRLNVLAAARAPEAHRLLVHGYAGGGGSVGVFHTWWTELVGDAEFDLELCLLAETYEGEVIGFAQCWTSAFVKDLVVHQTWRRRGVGQALLLHAFGLFRARGASSVSLKVESDNPSGAARIYERLGMRAEPA